MADLRYRVDIDTTSAQTSLSNLRNTIAGFGSAIAGAFAFKEFTRVAAQLDDLRRTLQLLYRSTETGSQVFSEVGDLANQLSVDVGLLAEAAIKLRNGGIEPTVSRLKLFADVAKSSTDSLGALQSITDLYARTVSGGLGLEELERLQDRGIPVYRILREELGLARDQIAAYGQSAEGAERIRAALERGLTREIGGAAEKSFGSLSSSLTRLSNSIKIAADDLGQAGLNEIISSTADTISKFVQNNRELIVQLGQGMANAFKVFLENLDVVIMAGKVFFTVWAASKIANLILAFTTLGKAVGKTPLALLAVGALALAQQLGLLDDIMKKVSETFSDTESENFANSIKQVTNESNKLANSNGIKVLKEGVLGQAPSGNLITDAFRKFKEETMGIAAAFALSNKEQRDSIELNTRLIGATSEYSEVLRAQAEISKRAAQEIQKLEQQKAKLSESERREGRGEVIDQAIAKIKEQAEADKAATEQAVKNGEARQRVRQVELFAIQSQINLQEQLYSIQDEIAKLTLTEIEKKYYDIEAAAKRAARAAIQAEEARIGRPLSAEEQQKYYDEAAKGIDILKQKTREQYEESRNFSTGWKQAMNEYVENATNGAKMAKDIFTKATQGMEDAIVNFAKTGKFEFKSFMSSILEDLLRSQVRQLMGQVFNFGGGRSAGSTTGSFLGSLLGFANGGIIPTNAPVLVGERGPEIISGAAGRVVTPNNQLGSSNVTYNINAVDAASFKSMIAADPSFIHAVAMQGGASIPSRR